MNFWLARLFEIYCELKLYLIGFGILYFLNGIMILSISYIFKWIEMLFGLITEYQYIIFFFTYPISISFVLLIVFSCWVLLNKMKLKVVMPKINVVIIKTIAITIQMFTKQNARPSFITQFCNDEQGLSLHVLSILSWCSSLFLSWTVMMTFDELLNCFPFM